MSESRRTALAHAQETLMHTDTYSGWGECAGALLALLGIGAYLLNLLHGRSMVKRLPSISDDMFCRAMGGHIDIPDIFILQSRRLIARTVGIPETRLHPSLTVECLTQADGLNSDLGVGNVLDDLVDRLPRDEQHRHPRTAPGTVGDIIVLMWELRDKTGTDKTGIQGRLTNKVRKEVDR
jgi:hypothetical protein